MKQILQNLKNGKTESIEVPVPSIKAGHILIKTTRSLLSAGTERMLVEFGKANLFQKAKAQPDKVKQVLEKVKTDGLSQTMETVLNRLDEALPLGYCNVGTVVEVGRGVENFSVGDRVASNGNHAEFVCVPKNLCAKIPNNVSDDEATFTVLGSIGLEGVRLAQPELGQKVVVFGAGLIGLVVVQLLRASGCHVLAIDLHEDRLKLAEAFGAEIFKVGEGDAVKTANSFSNQNGVDSVIITASAKTDEIIHQAAQMCRKRGKVVLIGVVGLNILRSDFYEKELTFQVSCSYGPGRYDIGYEELGNDYPIGFVRWTEQRNFEAILGAISSKSIDMEKLITHKQPFNKAIDAYDIMTNDSSALGIILQYKNTRKVNRTVHVNKEITHSTNKCVAAIIGAGNFSKMTMSPALSKTNSRLKYIVARTNGASATHIAGKFKIEQATTDIDLVWGDNEVNTVFIATNHNSHSSMLQKAILCNKNVFVEKPLCLNVKELNEILKVMEKIQNQNLFNLPNIMVGFNRRFSPHIEKAKSLLSGRSNPISMNMTINAGIIPADHWVHDPIIGGGRIIGEACHFIDLLSFICNSRVVRISSQFMQNKSKNTFDTISISLGFEDGSIGIVNYFANGNKSYPKEFIEIFSDGRVLQLNNFKSLRGYGFSGFNKFNTWSLDKGHNKQFLEYVDSIDNTGKELIPFNEIVLSTLASFAAVKSGLEKRSILLEDEYSDIFQKIS